jgi:hypothetical protein
VGVAADGFHPERPVRAIGCVVGGGDDHRDGTVHRHVTVEEANGSETQRGGVARNSSTFAMFCCHGKPATDEIITTAPPDRTRPRESSDSSR